MKPVHIVILIVVSIGLAIAVSFYGDTSKYVCFKEADSIAVDSTKPSKVVLIAAPIVA